MKIERTIVAIDFSERSIAAAQWVARHFAPKSELVLVHALELPPPPLFLRGRASWREDDVETCRTGARLRLRQLGGQIGRETHLGRGSCRSSARRGAARGSRVQRGSHCRRKPSRP